MSNWTNEAEAREQIKEMVAQYYHDFKEKKEPFKERDRISYASRVFDEKEMQALTDATLDSWLTTGRFPDQFEKEFAEWIGVKYAHLVNSGSSANLCAFMALTSPKLGSRRICKGDEVITVAASDAGAVARDLGGKEGILCGITSGAAVLKINNELGYRPVTFEQLTDDPAFWRGCQTCVNYDVLQRTDFKRCICTAMLYDPSEHPDEQLEDLDKI